MKPCPFCGSKNTKVVKPYGVSRKLWWVRCEGCSAIGPNPKKTQKEAIKAWDTRIGK